MGVIEPWHFHLTWKYRHLVVYRRNLRGCATGIYTSFLPYAKVSGEVGLISCYGT